MKEHSQSVFSKIYAFLEKKYKAPEECKLLMAEKNLSTMLKAQIMLILLGIYGIITILIFHKGEYQAFLPRFIYFAEYIVFGLLCIFLSSRLKRLTFARSRIKMIPTYFLFIYLMIYPLYILYYEKNTFNAMIVYACVTVNFPVFFDISPAIYAPVVTIASAALMPHISEEYNMFIVMDSAIFVLILYFLAFKRWAAEKDNFLHHRSEHEYKENIENEIRLAQVVQQSFFRHNETIYDEWSVSYYNKPMAGVSGDFLDIYNSGNNLDGIGIFDVSGHGIASGLVTMLVKNIIFQEFNNGRKDKLKSIVDRINIRYIKEKGNIENYLTGILARIDGNKIEFINAGHAMPILYKAKEDSANYIEDDNSSFGAIGLPDLPTNFITHSVELTRGDELIFFTDGATEATNAQGEDFGKERLLKSIFRNADRPLTTQVNCIVSDILTFVGNEAQKDDITVIILKKK